MDQEKDLCSCGRVVFFYSPLNERLKRRELKKRNSSFAFDRYHFAKSLFAKMSLSNAAWDSEFGTRFGFIVFKLD